MHLLSYLRFDHLYNPLLFHLGLYSIMQMSIHLVLFLIMLHMLLTLSLFRMYGLMFITLYFLLLHYYFLDNNSLYTYLLSIGLLLLLQMYLHYMLLMLYNLLMLHTMFLLSSTY